MWCRFLIYLQLQCAPGRISDEITTIVRVQNDLTQFEFIFCKTGSAKSKWSYTIMKEHIILTELLFLWGYCLQLRMLVKTFYSFVVLHEMFHKIATTKNNRSSLTIKELNVKMLVLVTSYSCITFSVQLNYVTMLWRMINILLMLLYKKVKHQRMSKRSKWYPLT